MAKTKEPAQVYQLKIMLQEIKPPVWRQVQLKDCTLSKLHHVIQKCMGWDNFHLHSFTIDDEEYSEPDPDGTMEAQDERKVKLSTIVAQGVKNFSYVYDFGDSWEHTIQIEKVLPVEAGVQYPRCTDGKRACPPEDCGGPWGYGDFLEAVQNPKHPEHEDQLEWVGGKFDPEKFDMEAISKKLR